jgi:hypothetical protein
VLDFLKTFVNVLNDCFSTNDNYNNYEDTRERDLYRKFDNMTTSEIDYWIKHNDIDDVYGEYSRETKVNKLVDKMKSK